MSEVTLTERMGDRPTHDLWVEALLHAGAQRRSEEQTMSGTGIGLTMIVKNEAHVIERCLRSVLPWISWWEISDTGSTDGTQDLIREVMAGVPGRLHQDEWVDFGTNRQIVLNYARAARSPNDYALIIDADEELVGGREIDLFGLDGYHLPVTYEGTTYDRLALLRLGSDWEWLGAIHEVSVLPEANTARLTGPTIQVKHEGARALDPTTRDRDIEVMQDALRADPGDPRMQYYLAQTLREAGRYDEARAAYQTRIENQTGWVAEVWASWMGVARSSESEPVRLHAFTMAYEVDPDRAEPLIEMARIHREANRPNTALMLLDKARGIPKPGRDALFVEEAAYGWRLWDEVALCHHRLGIWEGAEEAGTRALELCPKGPERERLQENLGFYRAATNNV